VSDRVDLIDFERVLGDFPILSNRTGDRQLTYLDSAATTQKPGRVIERMDRFYRSENANIHRGVHHLSQIATREFDIARERIRTLVNAESSREIIFTSGCTDSINLAAHSLSYTPEGAFDGWKGFGEGRTILLSTMEHHSNIVPWQIAGQRTGTQVLPIPISDAGEVDLEEYLRLLREYSVSLVGIVHVSNSLGTVNPVKEMVRLAHEHGAICLVDGAQAVAHSLVDVQDLDADFYTLSGHKVYGPTGVGALYGKEAILRAMPPYKGGGDMIRTVSFERTSYADLPAKFEAGTPNISGIIGFGEAAAYLEALGGSGSLSHSLSRSKLEIAYKAISAHETALVEAATETLAEIPGLHLSGTAKHKAGIVSFTMENAHPHDIGTILDQSGVAIRAGHHCCMPLMKRLGVPATARASFGIYNSFADVARLGAAVRRVREILF
jgi:cysteine desulfurase / selenocysteine lyase